jgi:hypothetical protein
VERKLRCACCLIREDVPTRDEMAVKWTVCRQCRFYCLHHRRCQCDKGTTDLELNEYVRVLKEFEALKEVLRVERLWEDSSL